MSHDYDGREYVRELEEKVKALTAERDEIVGRIAIEEAYERRAFIRDAAIAIYSEPTPADVEGCSVELSWHFARALWDAKPEDC